MILSHRVALNGVQLDSVDNRILVQGVDEAAGKDQVSAVGIFGGVGQRITNRHRDYLDVTVRFSLKIKKNDMQARSDVFERVNAWAAPGGWLTVNYKAGRRLRVVRYQCPAAGDQWAWTSVYSITFRAYAVPYWQQEDENRLMATGSSITRQFGVAGSEKSVMNVAFKNTSSSACAAFSITAGESTITLSSLSLGQNETLYIDHTEDGLLRIRIRSAGGVYRSALNKRTAESSDDLWVSPGTVTVTMTAQRAGTLTISCAGRFA